MSRSLPCERLEEAYRQGIFPMADDEGEIHWYSPDPRTIIEFERFHVSSRLARTIRSRKFEITVDRDFEGVVRGCAATMQLVERRLPAGSSWEGPETVRWSVGAVHPPMPRRASGNPHGSVVRTRQAGWKPALRPLTCGRSKSPRDESG